MRLETPGPWVLLFEQTLSNVLGASAWLVELKYPETQKNLILALRGDPKALSRRAASVRGALEATAQSDRRAFAWVEADDSRESDGGGTPAESMLAFSCRLGAGALLSGCVAVNQEALSGVPFPDERHFLKFIENLAVGVSREIRQANEIAAMQRLFSSLSLQCILFNRDGDVVLNTIRASDGVAPTQARKGLAAPRLERLIKQSLAKCRTGKAPRSRPYHVGMFDQGEGNRSPFYVLPLLRTATDDDPAFVAVLFPKRSDPPAEDTIAAALSLTPAEARVVRRISEGKKTRDIADETSLTEQTIRTYLKRIYHKLGISGQGELITKVNELSIPISSRIGAIGTEAVAREQGRA